MMFIAPGKEMQTSQTNSEVYWEDGPGRELRMMQEIQDILLQMQTVTSGYQTDTLKTDHL